VGTPQVFGRSICHSKWKECWIEPLFLAYSETLAQNCSPPNLRGEFNTALYDKKPYFMSRVDQNTLSKKNK